MNFSDDVERALDRWFVSAGLSDPALSPDIPRLRKAVEWVEAEAAKPKVEDRQWYQVNYFVQSSRFTCGTVCCVAGKVALEDGWTPQFSGMAARYCYKDGVSRTAHEVAQEALGLTDVQATRLFAGTNTAERVREIAEAIAGERL